MFLLLRTKSNHKTMVHKQKSISTDERHLIFIQTNKHTAVLIFLFCRCCLCLSYFLFCRSVTSKYVNMDLTAAPSVMKGEERISLYGHNTEDCYLFFFFFGVSSPSVSLPPAGQRVVTTSNHQVTQNQ